MSKSRVIRKTPEFIRKGDKILFSDNELGIVSKIEKGAVKEKGKDRYLIVSETEQILYLLEDKQALTILPKTDQTNEKRNRKD